MEVDSVQCFFNNTRYWNGTETKLAMNLSNDSQSVEIFNYMTDAEIMNPKRGTFNPTFSDNFLLELPNDNTAIVVAKGVINDYSGSQLNGTLGVVLIPCTCELGWYSSKGRFANGIVQSQGPPQKGDAGIQRARADESWFATINPFLPDMNRTAQEWINMGISQGDLISLSTLLTVALSNMSPSPSIDFAYYGRANGLNETFINPPDPITFPTQNTLHYSRMGFRYTPENPTTQLSLTILLAYCVIALVHIAFSVWTGISSSAWASLPEVVALALSSRPATELENTCAGIQTMSVFKHQVRIAAVEAVRGVGVGHVELVFASSAVSMDAAVRPNESYGL